MDSFDLLVIGGGINGAAIARDAAGRGLDVLLVEKDDLASHTSSASSKLIHGGLRYLEQYEFRLVRESLHEREILLRTAPHIVRPLRFVLPDPPGGRPVLDDPRSACSSTTSSPAAASLPRSRAVGRKDDALRAPLKPRLQARHLLGRLGRRCPPGRPQRARRGRARRRDRHPHRIPLRPPRRRRLDRRRCPAAASVRAGDDRQRRRPLGRRGAQRSASAPRRESRVRLVKGSHILVPAPLAGRPRLYPPARGGRPRRLRASLWRAQPDRHHRRPRRPARGRDRLARGDRLSLRRRQCLFRQADRARRT